MKSEETKKAKAKTTRNTGQVRHLIKVLGALGATKIECQQILETGIIPDLFEAVRRGGMLHNRNRIRLALGLDEWPDPTYFEVTVRVNRQFSLHEAVLATGCDLQGIEGIPDRPSEDGPRGDVIISLFHFGKGRDMYHDEILTELRAYGFRGILVEELLSLSAQHPHLQTKFPIAGVGCENGGDRYWMIDRVPTGLNQGKRRVSGNFDSKAIHGFYRVAAVRDRGITPTKFLLSELEDRVVSLADSESEARVEAWTSRVA